MVKSLTLLYADKMAGYSTTQHSWR